MAESRSGPHFRWLALAAAALAAIGCDRATKHAATVFLAGESDRSYLADTVRLGYTENTGGFFEPWGGPAPSGENRDLHDCHRIRAAGLVAPAVRDRFAGPSGVGLVLFVAGGASNWIDRVLSGSVVDFLNVGIGPLRTGVFNDADVAIMVGAGFFAFGAATPTSEAPTRGTPRIGRD